MRKQKTQTAVWLLLSACFAGLVVAAIVLGLSGSVFVAVDTDALCQEAEEVLTCVHDGDFPALSGKLYGNPQLGSMDAEHDDLYHVLWTAYLSSIDYDFPGSYSTADDGIDLDITISCLDLSSVLDSVSKSAPQLAQENPDRYFQNGTPNPDVFSDAAVAAIEQNPQRMTRKMEIHFVQSEGEWKAVLNQGLLALLTGFISA